MATNLTYPASFSKINAFDAYMRQNVSSYDYSTEYNDDTGQMYVILFFNEAINQGRKEMIDGLVQNYVDPDVFYAPQWTDVREITGDTIVNDSDDTSIDWIPMSFSFVVNHYDDFVINEIRVLTVTNNMDGTSEADPEIVMKVTDMNQQVDICQTSKTPDGTQLSDGSVLSEVSMTDMHYRMTDMNATWCISGYVRGNISAKVVGIKYAYFEIQ